MSNERLNAYRIMWLFVFFDLPVVTKKQRKQAAHFRKQLLSFGFTMLQYSVYIRHCASSESADMHLKRVQQQVPPQGQVSILRVTDKQYGEIINYWGFTKAELAQAPQQLEIF